jgi:hypothetical protein
MPQRGANSGSALFRSYGVKIGPALFHILAATMGASDLLCLIVVGYGQYLGKRLLASLALELVNRHDVLLGIVFT